MRWQITGGARGIGAGICRALAEAGVTLAIVDLDGEGAQAVATTLPGSGHSGWCMDVADETSVETGLDAIEARHGPPVDPRATPEFCCCARAACGR